MAAKTGRPLITDPINLFGAFLVGLLGGIHCVGMCGGIVGALSLGARTQGRSGALALLPLQLAYNLGRITSYTLAGALIGGLGAVLTGLLPLYLAQRVLYAAAALVMILLGLYLGGWWRGVARIEQAGAILWRRLEPIGRRWLPVRRPAQAFGLGLVWGWLPCGLVYSVLVWAATAGTAFQGALLLLAFGLGTLPNLMAMGLAAGALAHAARNPWVRRFAGALVLGFGIYALLQLFAF